jgi:cytidylate kinase
MIVAIDGPSASGKSTVGRRLARHLGLPLVDTGLMYRAITVMALEQGIDINDGEALGRLTRASDLEVFSDPVDRPPWLVRAGERDLSRRIFDAAITPALTKVSQVAQVRQAMVERQRSYGRGGVVMLGRDIGTVVFPEADSKIFLTASEGERVRRRRRQLKQDPEATLKGEITDRDRADSARAVAPLRPASDARTIDTDGRSIDEVFAEVLQLIERPKGSERA